MPLWDGVHMCVIIYLVMLFVVVIFDRFVNMLCVGVSIVGQSRETVSYEAVSLSLQTLDETRSCNWESMGRGGYRPRRAVREYSSAFAPPIGGGKLPPSFTLHSLHFDLLWEVAPLPQCSIVWGHPLPPCFRWPNRIWLYFGTNGIRNNKSCSRICFRGGTHLFRRISKEKVPFEEIHSGMGGALFEK